MFKTQMPFFGTSWRVGAQMHILCGFEGWRKLPLLWTKQTITGRKRHFVRLDVYFKEMIPKQLTIQATTSACQIYHDTSCLLPIKWQNFLDLVRRTIWHKEYIHLAICACCFMQLQKRFTLLFVITVLHVTRVTRLHVTILSTHFHYFLSCVLKFGRTFLFNVVWLNWWDRQQNLQGEKS